MPRAKFARFAAGALRPQLSRGRAGPPPRGWWPGGLASVSEAGGPGLDSSLARALFCVAVSWFRDAGSFFRGSAMDFCFQPLDIAGLLLKSLLAQPLRGSTFPVAVPAKKLLLKLFPPSSGRRRSPAARGFSSIFNSLGLCAASRSQDGLLCSLQHGACFLEARVLLS